MNVIKCKNGHFFDGETYDKCPVCGESAGVVNESIENVQKEKKRGFWGRNKKDKQVYEQSFHSSFGETPEKIYDTGDEPTDIINDVKKETPKTPLRDNPTLDFWDTSAHIEEKKEMNENEDSCDLKMSQAEVVPLIESEKEQSQQVSSLRAAVQKSSASNEGKTMSYFSAVTAGTNTKEVRTTADPVVGWLVCIKGCRLGECFSLFAGKNSIGRGEENRVVIAMDNSISRVKHALIVYEPKKRDFYLQPGDSSGLTYLNDEYITESKKMKSHDIVELGDSRFVFIPLCNENFSWEDHLSKGE